MAFIEGMRVRVIEAALEAAAKRGADNPDEPFTDATLRAEAQRVLRAVEDYQHG
jgi:hypothetical protein